MASTSDKDLFKILLYGGSTRSGTMSATDIATLIDASANVYFAAARGALSEAGADDGVQSKRIDDVEYTYHAASAGGWGALAKQLRLQGVRSGTMAPYSGGISASDKAAAVSDADRVGPNFTIGQFDDVTTSSTDY